MMSDLLELVKAKNVQLREQIIRLEHFNIEAQEDLQECHKTVTSITQENAKLQATIERVKAVPELQIGIDHQCNEFGCSFGTMDIRDGSCRYDLTHVKAIKGGYIWKPDLDEALSESEAS